MHARVIRVQNVFREVGELFPPHLPSIIFLLLQLCIVICENEVVLNNVLQTAREIIIR